MLNFRRLGSSTLYFGEAVDSSSGGLGQVLFALPSQTPVPPATLSLNQAWDFQHPSLGAGYFLFTDQGANIQSMSADEISALAMRLHLLLPGVVRNQHASLGWVTGNPLTPSTVRVQTLNMVRVDGTVRTQNIPQAIRFQQYELMVLPATPFERTGSGFLLRNTEYMAPPGADPRTDQPTNRRIYFRGAAAHDIDKVGDTVSVPLMGDGRGSLQFSLNGIGGVEIKAGILDVAMYYVVPEPEIGRDQSLRYPLLNLTNPSGGGASSEVNFQARLYPANPLQSIFDFGNSNTSDGPVIQSYFATYHGYPVKLVPQAGSGLMFTHVPNPGVYPSRAAEVRTHFSLIPVGSFEMTLCQNMGIQWWLTHEMTGAMPCFRPVASAGSVVVHGTGT